MPVKYSAINRASMLHPLPGSGITIEKGREILQELEVRKEQRLTVSSRSDGTDSFMSSWYLWLPTQDLHTNRPVNTLGMGRDSRALNE